MNEFKDISEEELTEKIHEAINRMKESVVWNQFLRFFSSGMKPLSEEDKNRLVNEFKESINHEK